MRLAYLAFTEKGFALAERLAAALGGEAARCNAPLGLRAWTEAQFAAAEGLVYVGAVGIAVRAVAPHLKSKVSDPAVVAVDECARFAVPLLSGHLGGANDLARCIAAVCGAVPVITTATDANGVFAVDAWARHQNCRVVGTEKIKKISGRLLAGGEIAVCSDWPIAGLPPAGVRLVQSEPCDVRVSLRRGRAEKTPDVAGCTQEQGLPIGRADKAPDAAGCTQEQGLPIGRAEKTPDAAGCTPEQSLRRGRADKAPDAAGCTQEQGLPAGSPDELLLVPRIAALGVGCRRGTTCEALEQALAVLVRHSRICTQGIYTVASIDLKENEPGLREFCQAHGWPLVTYSAGALRAVPGEFTPSAFVRSVTGVDNVCERAAVAASGGALIQTKLAGGGVTMALAQKPYAPDWSWKDE